MSSITVVKRDGTREPFDANKINLALVKASEGLPDQISKVVIGKSVKVLIDNATGGVDTLQGTVSWISSQSEFTPKIIQTRDERVNLVYAFKVKVANDKGTLKSGMPGEIILNYKF